MVAILLLARAELRRRWPSLLALGLLAGLVGAAVLGAAAAARRTATAYDRLERTVGSEDARILVPAGTGADLDDVTRLPVVAEAWVGDVVIGQRVGPSVTFGGIVAGPRRPPGLLDLLPVRGRLPDDGDAGEIVVSEQFSQVAELDVGDELILDLLTAEEVTQFDVGFGDPDGPRIELRVVGVVRVPGSPDLGSVVGTPALAELVGPDLVAIHLVYVRLDGGPGAIGALRDGLDELAAELGTPAEGVEEFSPFEVVDSAAAQEPVDASARVLVAGLLVFALLALVVGGFVTVQAFTRYQAAVARDQGVHEALGLTRRARALAAATGAVLPATVAGVVAAAVAVAVSPAAPIGKLRQYEPDPGLDVNVAVLVGGVALIAALLVTVAAVAALRTGGRRRAVTPRWRPGLADRVAAAGGPETVVIGLRMAFEARRDAGGAPARSALAGATLGVIGIVAVVALATSIDRLTATPARYGWQGVLLVIDVQPEEVRMLAADERVASIAVLESSAVEVDGEGRVRAYGIDVRKGSLGWTLLEGRMPTSPDEVAAGTRIADRLDLGVGDDLTVRDTDGAGTRHLRVVGIGLGPISGDEALGANLVLTHDGLEPVAVSAPFREAYIAAAPDVDTEQLVAELAGEYEVTPRARPPDVENLAQLGRLPELLTALMAALVVAAVGNAVVVSVRRRRHDLAVLRAMGYTGRQLARAVHVMAVVSMVVAAAIGLPLGVAVAGVAWRDIASRAYVADDLAMPTTVLALAVPAAVLIGVALAAMPARRARAVRPAEALRAE